MKTISQIILENKKEESKKEHDEFFRSLLDEYGVESPAELSDEQKSEFFDKVKAGPKKTEESEGKKEEDVEEVDETLKVEKEPETEVGDLKGEDDEENAGTQVDDVEGDGDASSDKIEDDGMKMGEPTTSGDGEDLQDDGDEVNESKNDYVVRYDNMDIHIKNGYKYSDEKSLEKLYNSLGKVIKSNKLDGFKTIVIK